MLSRIAESLFWIGRFVERAEDTARILDVHFHVLVEDPAVDEELACQALLDVMGAQRPLAPGRLAAQGVTEVLAFDEANPSSIAGSLSAARENARGAREAIPSEMWEALNGAYMALPALVDSARGQPPHGFFGWVKDRGAVLAGLADSTMSRDDGWRFLVLGRSLERVDMTTRLVSAGFGEASGSLGGVSLLRSCSAHEAYLRTYHRAVDASLVAEFLLLDRLLPRSVFHALGTAEHCLAELDPRSTRVGLDDEARRILGRGRTELEFRRVDELLGDLPKTLASLQSACADAARAVSRRYFRQTSAIEWSARGEQEVSGR